MRLRLLLAVALTALLALTSLAADSVPIPAPAPSQVATVDVPAVSTRFAGGKLYDEILNRDPQPYTTSDRATNAHESCHGVNSRLRIGAAAQKYGKGNGFYLGDGKGAIVPEPRMRLREVAAFVPASLRGPNFSPYLVQQAPHWDDHPTYICDEWTAYLMGSAVIIQDCRDGRSTAGGYSHHGPVEFTLYALALSRAVAHHDAETWQRKPELKAFIAHQAEYAGKLYAASRRVPGFIGGQEEMLNRYQASADAAPLREFVAKEFGQAVGWLSQPVVTVKTTPPDD